MAEELIESKDVPKNGEAPDVVAPPEVIDSVPGVDQVAEGARAAERAEPELFGGYTGQRPSQTPGARYEAGMPISVHDLDNPKPGQPEVPHLGPGDPRAS